MVTEIAGELLLIWTVFAVHMILCWLLSRDWRKRIKEIERG